MLMPTYPAFVVPDLTSTTFKPDDDSNCCVWTSNNFSNFLASNYKSNIDFASNTASKLLI